MITDLTLGKPAVVLCKFSLPMLLSVVFQQMYNIADSIIAGQFIGENALAAIGASYPVTMIFMAIAMGCNLGCSVVISQFFGAKNYQQMKTSITTSFISVGSLSLLLTVLGIIFSGQIVMLLNTPENIYNDSIIYLNIYTGGLIFLFMYNICTSVFSALGDSKTPLYLLIGSSIGNILLDLLTVTVFNMGIAGIAWATFIAQGISAVIAFIILNLRISRQFSNGNCKIFSAKMLKKISRVAIPSILQQSFVSIGNLFIQSIINSYGSAVIAGYSSAIKLNTFAVTSFTTLSGGVSNFTAQNIGAGKMERVKKGFKTGVVMALIVVVVFTFFYIFFGEQLINLFMDNGSDEALKTGLDFLYIVSPFYVLVSIKLISDSVLRGSGAMKFFMITTFTDLILRVVLAFIFSATMGVVGVWISWPIGWGVSSLMSVIFYLSGCWKPKT